MLRSIPLWSERLGLTGRADIVEIDGSGRFTPIEYKSGTLHEQAAEVQLAAQALCLEEMTGQTIDRGFIWLSGTRRRVRVEIDERLRRDTVTVIDEVRAWFTSDRLPPPVCDGRCRRCQFLDHCQPELSSRPETVTRYLREVLGCVS